jgi:hypothetical protein
MSFSPCDLFNLYIKNIKIEPLSSDNSVENAFLLKDLFSQYKLLKNEFKVSFEPEFIVLYDFKNFNKINLKYPSVQDCFYNLGLTYSENNVNCIILNENFYFAICVLTAFNNFILEEKND